MPSRFPSKQTFSNFTIFVYKCSSFENIFNLSLPPNRTSFNSWVFTIHRSTVSNFLDKNKISSIEILLVFNIANSAIYIEWNLTKLEDFKSFFMGQSWLLFVYFHSFLVTISIQIEKSVDGVLGIWTQGHRMVGADESTELWRPPQDFKSYNAQITIVWPSLNPQS